MSALCRLRSNIAALKLNVRVHSLSRSLGRYSNQSINHHSTTQTISHQSVSQSINHHRCFSIRARINPDEHEIEDSASSFEPDLSTDGEKPKPTNQSIIDILSQPCGPSPEHPVNLTDVTIVNTVTQAKKVLSILMSEELMNRYHAIDTEVANIDLKIHSPVKHGNITCFTVFAGPDLDFGNGPRLFIDCLDLIDDEVNDQSINQSISQSISQSNEHSDSQSEDQLTTQSTDQLTSQSTDPSTDQSSNQSADPSINHSTSQSSQRMLDIFRPYLESQSIKKVFHNFSFDSHQFANHGIQIGGFAADTMHMARLADSSRMSYSLENLSYELCERGKLSMKSLFAVPQLKKDGTPGKKMLLPKIDEMQRGPKRDVFIDYATFDAQSTFQLRQVLERQLKLIPNPTVNLAEWMDKPKHLRHWQPPPPIANQSINQSINGSSSQSNQSVPSQFDFYCRFYVPFAAMLVDMERLGIRVRAADYLAGIEKLALADADRAKLTFLNWAEQYERNAKYMNIASNKQKRHLFFGKDEMSFDRLNVEGLIEPGKKKPKKKIAFTLKGFGMPPVTLTKKKEIAVSLPVLRRLCGRVDGPRPSYGLAYEHFKETGDESKGVDACKAVSALCQIAALGTMLGTFIEPLQTMVDDESRIHASLGLNTETGRLSCRKPNLQNQPALEKDIYKVRDAFEAGEGKLLVVADYGQLELRMLAHMTNCKSMIQAFELGGDFHSRTAMGMYDHVREAVATGRVALESAKGSDRSVPLLKDEFASERRKAKTLNFSIAYGKTARGLANDWGTTLAEAEDTLAAWYRDRPEVKQWQENTIKAAHDTGATVSFMGRQRILKGINGKDRALRSHLERAAINTPIQGGAADVVMMAMIKLHAHQRFYDLGWRAILQIHDEIISEGPAESVDEAMKIVRECMGRPFAEPLLIDLVVDAKKEKTWYKAK